MRGKEDDLDSLLDTALATYADPGVVPDLAERVLASIRHVGGRKRPDRWLPWVVEVPAFAVLLLAVLLIARHSAPSASVSSTAGLAKLQIAGTASATEENKSDAERMGPIATAHLPLKIKRSSIGDDIPATTHEQPLPRLEVFPAPAPLTKEERALTALVSQSPGDASQSMANRQQNATEPVHIAAIQIPPINPPDKGEN
jgi:hypothetical protein